ncbi:MULTISPECIES: NAD-dependent epimerase/dehydratase family protein [unclassified Microbacterium]|uniref:NAD-dependent epimerase/dehydratase family protein n=1 Tax=unclassified Microbacterium TaxID=2609290 RepID=UPI0036631A36
MKILYTGANGRMAVVIREALSAKFDEVVLFVRTAPTRLFPGETVVTGDLRDLSALQRAVDDVDVIIHLGGIADESSFAEILSSNIEGTYNVLEAARLGGVRRVVFASSNHVTGFYPVTERIDADQPVRPDSYYGVSKVFGEALGRLYHDKWGLEIINLRIGSCRPAPEDRRQLRIWLSHRDAAQLFERAVLATEIGYLTLYGASANASGYWNNSAGEAALGYMPQDSAEDHAGLVSTADVEYYHQGGQYAGANYEGGSWVPRVR